MNALSAFAGPEVWHTAGWTMLHYLWLGALVGMLAAVGRVLLRSARPNLRYATALGCLFLLAALPFGIAAWLTSYPPPLMGGVGEESRDPVAIIELNSPSAPAHDNVIDLRNQHQPLVPAEWELQIGAVPTDEPQLEPSAKHPRGLAGHHRRDGRAESSEQNVPVPFTALTKFEAFVPYLPWLWIIGTPITFALLAAGIVGTKRLRRASRAANDPRIADMLARLQSSLRIGKRITVAICDRIASPVLLGIVRPIILLPPAAITGWSPDEIEMVLLHELAHVRRWDNLVNLIQRLIESLLFFHPAVWLVSTWVRRERESCCDAFVVRRTERPHAYAELLVALASQMPRSVLFHPAATSAMSAGPLRSRIRRILQLEDDPMLISGKSLAFTLSILIIAATFSALYLPAIGAAEESATEVTEGTEKNKVDKKKSNNESTDDVPVIDVLQAPSLTIELNADAQPPDHAHQKANPKPPADDLRIPEQKIIKRLPDDMIAGELIAVIDSLIDSGEAKDKNILIALPPKAANLQFEIAKAMRERHKSGKIADASTAWIDGNQIELIVAAPEPVVEQANSHADTVTDDWLKGIAFQSPKDAEIAKRAWRELGVKIVPPSDEELKIVRENGLKGGLKLLDLEDRLNLQGPLILTNIQSKKSTKGIASFDALAETLDELASLPADEIIVLSGFAKGSSVFQYSLKRKQADVAGETVNAPASVSKPTADDERKLQSLSVAVAEFNTKAKSDPVGARQPPLSVEEVIAAIRGWIRKQIPASDEVFETYQRIAETQQLPSGATLTFINGWHGYQGFDFDVWWIDLSIKTGPSSGYTFRIRDTKLRSRPSRDNGDRLSLSSSAPASPADRILEAYEIPTDLVDEVKNIPNMQGVWDDRGRFVMQATPERHKQFKSLLEATPKWRDPAAARERENDPIDLKKADGETILEWHSLGLTFIKNEGQDGVTVIKVAPGSPAAWHDIQPGDTLKNIERFWIANLAELESVIKTLLEGFASESKTLQMEFARELRDGRRSSLPKLLLLRPDHPNAPSNLQEARQSELIRSQERMHQQQKSQRPPAATQSEVPSYSPPPPEGEDAPPPKPRSMFSRKKTTPQGGKSNLRYDGKTFDDWRTEWQTELSTKKRLEAVNALAAFGRAGHGKEATDAILDIAGEYDFKTIDNTAEGSIKNAVLDTLAPYSHAQATAKHWVPSLAARLTKEPQKWESLAINLLRRLQTDDKGAIAILRSLAETAPEGVRRAALGALVRSNRLQSGSPQIDDTTQALLTASLKSKDPAVIRSALDSLYYQPVPSGTPGTPQLVFQPELVPLLLHSDKTVQQSARYCLAHIHDDDAPQVVESLLAILQDDSRKLDHLAAIRAFGAIGPKAAAAQPQIEKIFDDHSQDAPLIVAAAIAADRIEGGGRLHSKLNDLINKLDEKAQTKMIQLLNAEQQIANY